MSYRTQNILAVAALFIVFILAALPV